MKITLHWKYLKYDIDSETFKSGKIALEGNPEAMNEAQMDDAAMDTNYAYRKVQEAVAGLYDVLHKFVSLSSTDSANNDAVPTETTKWEITLTLNSRRKVDSASFANSCHQYVVERVLAEWSKMTLPAMESVYLARLAQTLQDIQKVVYRKEAPVL